MKGWVSKLDEDRIPREYHRQLDSTLNPYPGETLTSLTRKITETAEKCQIRSWNPSRRPEQSPELKSLIRQRRAARENPERRQLSKAIAKQARKELRSWRTLWANHLLERLKNTKFLQKINVDPVKSVACPVDSSDFAVFLNNLFTSSSGEVLHPDLS